MHSQRKEIKADHGPERPALGAFHQSRKKIDTQKVSPPPPPRSSGGSIAEGLSPPPRGIAPWAADNQCPVTQ